MSIFKFISNQLAPLTLICAIWAYFQPSVFLIFDGSILGIKVFLALFAITMFALGIVLQPTELKETARHPGQIGLGVLTQYKPLSLMRHLLVRAVGLRLVPNEAVRFRRLGFAGRDRLGRRLCAAGR